MLSYEDVGRSADWTAAAFGFTETGRWSNQRAASPTSTWSLAAAS